MQHHRSKRYQIARVLVENNRKYLPSDAIDILKKMPVVHFDQTVTLSARLGVDPKQSDQMVRGTCPLPHGSGKNIRVLVFATGQAAIEAQVAGSEFVGFEDLIQKIQSGFSDFDVAVATPITMLEVRKLGKILGPRGLMPNPKTGTVTENTGNAVKEIKAGRVEFKLDKNGNVAVRIGKFSFEKEKLLDNANSFVQSLLKSRPATAKGIFLESLSISCTMSPSVCLDLSYFLKN